MTSVIETEGIGAQYSGSAIGFVMVFSMLGSIVAPPLGNSIAALAPSAPFGLWTLMSLAGIVAIYMSRGRPHHAI